VPAVAYGYFPVNAGGNDRSWLYGLQTATTDTPAGSTFPRQRRSRGSRSPTSSRPVRP